MGMSRNYDLVVVGTGFASSFFLSRYLEKAAASARILVLERGRLDPHSWQVQEQRVSSFDEQVMVSAPNSKPWVYAIGFGGGSNCWWACTPRMLPNDFRLKHTYGVGRDWPLSYVELEPYYQEVEHAMAVSGPDDGSPYPRSEPYPFEQDAAGATFAHPGLRLDPQHVPAREQLRR